jgi:sugar transferase (PEP-CTERM/EpsH1 system associated)
MHIQESLEVGGLENGVVNVANNLDKGLFRTTICCINRLGNLAERIENPNVSCLTLDEGEGKKPMLPLTLSRLMNQKEVHIVHTHNFYSGIYGILAATCRLRRIGVIHGEHGMTQYRRTRRLSVAKHLYRLADRVVTMSKEQELFFRNLGIPDRKVVTILNGVDLKKFEPGRDVVKKKRELGMERAKIIVGCAGRLSAEKGQRYLIEALGLLNREAPETHLLLAGDGPARDELLALSNQLGLSEQIHFVGSRNDMHEIYPLFDVFCLPSLTEGLSNVLLEAMASRAPIVATAVGGNRELLRHGETALLVPSGSEKSLAEAITMLIADAGLRTELARKARMYVEDKFSLTRMVADYSNLYLELWSSLNKTVQ